MAGGRPQSYEKSSPRARFEFSASRDHDGSHPRMLSFPPGLPSGRTEQIANARIGSGPFATRRWAQVLGSWNLGRWPQTPSTATYPLGWQSFINNLQSAFSRFAQKLGVAPCQRRGSLALIFSRLASIRLMVRKCCIRHKCFWRDWRFDHRRPAQGGADRSLIIPLGLIGT